eukprot:TRINITY_DN102446_c0_g1_i1.p2 TRINITY_DN102446_c0_g1~~TRINITY_DN102446_c0_g1_i1.p2  ORF type:complete len:408 (-),score=128.30 TRINITY_DN102446_c0_g1_i1:173-1318(-)
MTVLSPEEEESLLLDPPDPVDLLIAHTDDSTQTRARPLDFVREKMASLKQENKQLKARVADLEQTLSIVQTAQEWTMGKGMTAEQAEKMRDIKALLEQAKRARQDIQTFSEASRTSIYEKLRQAKNALRREREEKAQMKERLVQAFHHARVIQDQHRRVVQQREEESQAWADRLRDSKERHRRELRRLQGDAAAQESDRQDQLSLFGEQVISELSNLQQHLKEVRQETVDSVLLEEGEAATYYAGAGGEKWAGGNASVAEEVAEEGEVKLLFFNPWDTPLVYSVGGVCDENGEMQHSNRRFTLPPKSFKTFAAMVGDLVLASDGDEFVLSEVVDSGRFDRSQVRVASLYANNSEMCMIAQQNGRSIEEMQAAADSAPVPPE